VSSARPQHDLPVGRSLADVIPGVAADRFTTDQLRRFDDSGGEIIKVVFDMADDAYIDVEGHLAAAMSRD
jgi:hypothetical protein